MQRLGLPDREPGCDQVHDAQHDGDRVPNRGLEGHGEILSSRPNLLDGSPTPPSRKSPHAEPSLPPGGSPSPSCRQCNPQTTPWLPTQPPPTCQSGAAGPAA